MEENQELQNETLSLDALIDDAKKEIKHVDSMLGNTDYMATKKIPTANQSDGTFTMPPLENYTDVQYVQNEPTQPSEPKTKWKMPPFLKVLIYICLVLTASILLAVFGWKCAEDVLALTKPDRIVNVTVAENATIADVAQTLYDNNLIEYPWLFRFYCRFSHAEDKIDPGTYQLNNLFDYHALVNGMNAGAGERAVVTLTIPEGYELKSIFALLEENGVCSAEKLEKASANYHFEYDFLKELPYGDQNRLEGYLFPDTYEFYLGQEPEQVLDKFLHNFDKKLTPDLRDSVDGLNEQIAAAMKANGFSEQDIQNSMLSLHDVITVASLIEKETANDSESPTIASVIYNRICSKDYPCLQIDATIQYALDERKEVLSEADKAVISPYNTYTNAGLPAGPIANPGINSIRAALRPEKTPYYFYALGKDGVHKFSETYAQHQEFLASLEG